MACHPTCHFFSKPPLTSKCVEVFGLVDYCMYPSLFLQNNMGYFKVFFLLSAMAMAMQAASGAAQYFGAAYYKAPSVTKESFIFMMCDQDGDEGLTWNEVLECEDVFGHLLHMWPTMVILPTKEDFDSYDADKDGILFLEELMEPKIIEV